MCSHPVRKGCAKVALSVNRHGQPSLAGRGERGGDQPDIAPLCAHSAGQHPVRHQNAACFAGQHPVEVKKAVCFAGQHPVGVKNAARFAGQHPVEVKKAACFAGQHPVEVKKAVCFAGQHPVGVKKAVCFAPFRAARSKRRRRLYRSGLRGEKGGLFFTIPNCAVKKAARFSPFLTAR